MTNRRDFLARTSQVFVGLALGGRRPGLVQRLPGSVLRSGVSAYAIVPEHRAPVDLSVLAAQAIDAAKTAGASYADIRLAEWFNLQVILENGGIDITLLSKFSYGLRVIVNGSWAFIHGCVPESDRLVLAAQSAVATARSYAGLSTTPVTLAPAPPAQGSWTTPIRADPFSVPLQDQIDLIYSLAAIGGRVRTGNIVVGFDWTKEIRTFGSTEGAMVTQTLYRAHPGIQAQASRTLMMGSERYLSHLAIPAAAGYEAVLSPALPDALKAETEAAMQASRLPVRRFDVGRFPVVLDGSVLGALFGQTVGSALELDRALGYEKGASGTSFLAPPTQVLGTTVINPLLNVGANRSASHIQAVKWDDEGVEPVVYPVLKGGVVVGYHSSRQCAAALAVGRQDQPMQSNGCATATLAEEPVMVRTPHLTVTPAAHVASIADLYGGISRGLLFTQRPFIPMDQQLSSGNLFGDEGTVFEIAHGKIVGRVADAGLQFATVRMWKSLMALGDATTTYDTEFIVSKGMPWRDAMGTTSAPAGLFADVDVIDTGRSV